MDFLSGYSESRSESKARAVSASDGHRQTFDVQVSVDLEDAIGETEGMLEISRRGILKEIVVVE